MKQVRDTLTVVAVALLILVYSNPASAQLTDAQVMEAIQAGQKKRVGPLISDCSASAGFGENMAAGLTGGIQRTGAFHVTVSGNEGRIASLAANAKRLYEPFTVANVPDDLRSRS